MRTNPDNRNVKPIVSLHCYIDIYVVIPVCKKECTINIHSKSQQQKSSRTYIPLTGECNHWSMNCCTEELFEEPKQQPAMKLPRSSLSETGHHK